MWHGSGEDINSGVNCLGSGPISEPQFPYL